MIKNSWRILEKIINAGLESIFVFVEKICRFQRLNFFKNSSALNFRTSPKLYKWTSAIKNSVMFFLSALSICQSSTQIECREFWGFPVLEKPDERDSGSHSNHIMVNSEEPYVDRFSSKLKWGNNIYSSKEREVKDP